MATPATIPLTEHEKSVILWQLASILESSPFRSSKRYPVMLEYCVRHTLDGDTEKLRERQLGIALFSRSPGYETSSDPIVRMAASEIRKRLSQYYDLAGDQTQVRISLPPGSYVTEFRFPDPSVNASSPLDTADAIPHPAHAVPDSFPEVPLHAAAAEHKSEENHHILQLGPALIFLAAVVVCVVGFWVFRSHQQVHALWRKFLDGSNEQVLAVVGQLVQPGEVKPPDRDPPLASDIYRTNHYVSVGDASSAMRACLVLARLGAECQIKAVSETDLSNVHGRPVLFVGAYNNPWVLRVTRFGDLACKCILDSKSGEHVGGVDFSIPRDKIVMDYSIIARFHSDVTDGQVVVIAGIGPMSTEAAAEFSSSSEHSRDLLSLAPQGWKGANVEAVLATDVVNGIPGHTRILRTAFW